MKKYIYQEIPKSTKKTLALIEKFKQNKVLCEISIGKILGDGSINKTGNLCFSQSVKQKDYIEHCFDLFKEYTRPNRTITSYMNKRKGKEHEILSFETCAIFKKELDLFYRYEEGTNKRIKIIPNSIDSMLSLRSLAYWIMDDGMYRTKKVFLCTHSFTLEENKYLASILSSKFLLPASIVQIKNCNYIENSDINPFWNIIRIDDTQLLWKLVGEYILPSFYYKFGKTTDLDFENLSLED